MVTPCSIHKIILGFDQTTWFDSNRGCVLLQTTWFDPIHGCVLLQTTWFDPIHGCVLPQTTWFDPNRSSVSRQIIGLNQIGARFHPKPPGLTKIGARFHPKPLVWKRNSEENKKTGHRMMRRGVSSCNSPAFHFLLLSSRTPSRPCRLLGRCGSQPSGGGCSNRRER